MTTTTKAKRPAAVDPLIERLREAKSRDDVEAIISDIKATIAASEESRSRAEVELDAAIVAPRGDIPAAQRRLDIADETLETWCRALATAERRLEALMVAERAARDETQAAALRTAAEDLPESAQALWKKLAEIEGPLAAAVGLLRQVDAHNFAMASKGRHKLAVHVDLGNASAAVAAFPDLATPAATLPKAGEQISLTAANAEVRRDRDLPRQVERKAAAILDGLRSVAFRGLPGVAGPLPNNVDMMFPQEPADGASEERQSA